VFRLKLGKAINYEYNEDSQTGLFQRRDPREGTSPRHFSSPFIHLTKSGGPALDIERGMALTLFGRFQRLIHVAMNKLEKVALKAARKRGKPLVLIINNVHFFKNDDQGRGMLLQLQQRAEAWAASGMYPKPESVNFTLLRLTDAGIMTCVFMT
jgi:hypothetical protein